MPCHKLIPPFTLTEKWIVTKATNMSKVLYYDKFDWVLFGNASMVIGMDEIA